jgi:hypothetical protein
MGGRVTVSTAAIVDHALRAAGIPIVGVSLGDLTDRSTWRVQFDPAATPTQQAQAATILATVAIDAPAQTAQARIEAQAQMDAIPIYLRAILLALVDQINVLRAALPIPLPALTPAQIITAIKTKASNLS